MANVQQQSPKRRFQLEYHATDYAWIDVYASSAQEAREIAASMDGPIDGLDEAPKWELHSVTEVPDGDGF